MNYVFIIFGILLKSKNQSLEDSFEDVPRDRSFTSHSLSIPLRVNRHAIPDIILLTINRLSKGPEIHDFWNSFWWDLKVVTLRTLEQPCIRLFHSNPKVLDSALIMDLKVLARSLLENVVQLKTLDDWDNSCWEAEVVSSLNQESIRLLSRP